MGTARFESTSKSGGGHLLSHIAMALCKIFFTNSVIGPEPLVSPKTKPNENALVWT